MAGKKTLDFSKYNLLSSSSKVRGQKVSVDPASDRTKRMKTQDLRTKSSYDESCDSANISVCTSGQTDTVNMVIELIGTTPKRAIRKKNCF